MSTLSQLSEVRARFAAIINNMQSVERASKTAHEAMTKAFDATLTANRDKFTHEGLIALTVADTMVKHALELGQVAARQWNECYYKKDSGTVAEFGRIGSVDFLADIAFMIGDKAKRLPFETEDAIKAEYKAILKARDEYKQHEAQAVIEIEKMRELRTALEKFALLTVDYPLAT